MKLALASFLDLKEGAELIKDALSDYKKAKKINSNSSGAFIGISNATSKLSSIRGY